MKRYENQHISINAPLDCFRARFGYKDRDSIQLRLNNDGTVYVCDDREGRELGGPPMAGSISWEVFASEWPGIVKFLLRKEHEAEEAKP
jgi:hypothetical protein